MLPLSFVVPATKWRHSFLIRLFDKHIIQPRSLRVHTRKFSWETISGFPLFLDIQKNHIPQLYYIVRWGHVTGCYQWSKTSENDGCPS